MYKISVPTIVTNGHFNKEKTLSQLKRCGAHRVTLALDRELEYTFSSKENLAIIKECIDYFRENGLEVAVWLGETMGHGSDKPYPNSKYTNMRVLNTGDISAFCPKDENFINDVAKWVKDIAILNPDMIMLDDDFRFGFHGGVACCCNLHMKAMSKELGETVSEDGLLQKIFGGKGNRYRSAWMKVQADSLRHYAKRLREELDTVSPSTRLGFCSVVSWDSEGWDPIEMSKLIAGGTESFLRLAGAPYWVKAESRTRLCEVIEIVRCELAYLKNNGIEIFTEGDTYPRPRQECPASYLECFDMVMRADGNSDGILKYMLDYVSDADYETGYIDAMLKNKDVYAGIAQLFDGKKAVGVRPYNAPHTVENADIAIDGFLMDKTQNVFRQPALTFTACNSLPVSYESDSVNILFGENARYIPENELKNGNVIDISAAKILLERGIDVGIECISEQSDIRSTGFSALPNEYFISENNYTRLEFGVSLLNITHKAGVNLLSEFVFGQKRIAGVFEYENADEMRFTVLPFDAYEAKRSKGWLCNYARRRQITKSIEWLGRKTLSAHIDGNHPDMYFMTKMSESSLSIGLWNLFDDRADDVKIKLGGKYKNIEFINCRGHIDGDHVTLDTPVYPYEFAGFEVYG